MSLKRVLVANRGEIASRVFRTCREMGIGTVAVYSDEDAAARFVREADIAVRLPGSRSADTYLQPKLILEAAARTGADAIHPGYGFLSENADFARACEAAGLVFIGPDAEAIEVMGDKLRSKRLMAATGVPTSQSIAVIGEVDDEVMAAAEAVGYPVLVKASAGGGGRGMRLVEHPGDLSASVESARREAASSFGDDTVFIEKYITRPRHIEVQVMADSHGSVAALFERECSVQRRHQKVLEEAPSAVVDADLRARLCEAAVTATRAVNYRGAGTVEFIMAPDGEFHFLEMNTRLQVEHPVTELITGLDLVRLQIDVASGKALPTEALAPTIRGHAIEARLYAEDVSADYLPTAGTVEEFFFEPMPGLRLDAGVEAGSVVSTHYDSMLAKVIAWGETRDEALRLLASSLRRARIAGVTTNRDLLVSVLEDGDFRSGDFSTAFLEQRAERLQTPILAAELVERLAVAAVVARSAGLREGVSVQTGISPGFRNNASAGQRVVLESEHGVHDIEYWWNGRHELRVRTGVWDTVEVRLGRIGATAVDLEIEGLRVCVQLARTGDRTTAFCPTGSVVFHERPRFPVVESEAARGTLTAPMPGSVLRLYASVDEELAEGDPVLVLEAMKMEHTVCAPSSGRVAELLVATGDQVEAGALLARIVGAADDS